MGGILGGTALAALGGAVAGYGKGLMLVDDERRQAALKNLEIDAQDRRLDKQLDASASEGALTRASQADIEKTRLAATSAEAEKNRQIDRERIDVTKSEGAANRDVDRARIAATEGETKARLAETSQQNRLLNADRAADNARQSTTQQMAKDKEVYEQVVAKHTTSKPDPTGLGTVKATDNEAVRREMFDLGRDPYGRSLPALSEKGPTNGVGTYKSPSGGVVKWDGNQFLFWNGRAFTAKSSK